MERLLWEEAVRFHGHECPGLAIGMKACEAIISKMNIKPKKDKIICITENNTCPIDGIKY
ncbi:formylmethanofuran dehydrogenase, partial [Clostridium perfringens]